MGSTMASRMKDGADRNQPAYWDARFAEAGFAYGTEPNDFLVSVADRARIGDALCLCEGEGRNAIFLGQRGFQVTAVDFSPVALAKSTALATERGVVLTTQECDLATFEPGVARWDHRDDDIRAAGRGSPPRAVCAYCRLPAPWWCFRARNKGGRECDRRFTLSRIGNSLH